MVRVLFVCLGNICRSPMAEAIFRYLVDKQDLSSYISVTSAGTTFETFGQDMHIEAKEKLDENNIPYKKHKAKRLLPGTYNNFDYIIGMDESNVNNIIKMLKGDPDKKVYKLLDFTKTPRDIADPWYTGNFTKAYDDILQGCKALLDSIIKKYKIETNEEELNKEEILEKIDDNIYKFTQTSPNKEKITEYLAIAGRLLEIKTSISSFENSEMTYEEIMPSLKKYKKQIDEFLFRFKSK